MEFSEKRYLRTVSIHEHEAELNNIHTKTTKLLYELDEEVADEKSPERILLEEEATELGITFRGNIGDAKLQEKVNKAKE